MRSPDTPPRSELNPVERLAGTTIATALAGVAALRRGKAVHPHGACFFGHLKVAGHASAPPAELLRRPARHPVIVRFSRSIGWPRPLPDLLGMSIRVPDAYGPGRHQDLMLISSVDLPVLHHLFVPVRDVWDAPYSSSLPFRAGSRRFLLGAVPRLDGPRPEGDTDFARLRVAVAGQKLGFDVRMASIEGRFVTTLAQLTLESAAPEELDALTFNPWNTGGDLEPAGWLNAIRAEAYLRSQRAWGVTQPGGRARQEHAQAEAMPADADHDGP